MVASLHGDRSGTMIEQAPLAVLQHTPGEQVELAGSGGDGGEEVRSVAPEANVLVVRLADGEGTVVCLGEPGAAIMIVNRKDAPQEVVAEVVLAEGKILQIDVQLGIGIHVEDALVSTRRHRRQVPRLAVVVAISTIKTSLTI